MARTKILEAKTTAQSLGSLIKSCRDIMRKDKGLNGDLDRLPMLTWVLFLKFLDDLENLHETEAKLEGKRFRPSIEPPYRWRDWAAKPDGITGDALIAFINQDEAVRPDGTRGPGLFAALRTLTGGNGGDRRDVIRAVFTGTTNRMLNGYLLRDMVNKIHGIHFTSSEEISTLSLLYESMLKEMRDAAGDSGEFYTPRAPVKFIVAVMNPRLGETVHDPAAGTGGFICEAFEHLKKQCRTAADFRKLQRESISGIEAKPLPYLLCQMNLLLHGLESPQIDSLNALRFKLGEMGDGDRVDVIMTNPPFGGEEERGVLGNFPSDKQTAETALLFLQLIMRKIRRRPKTGRAAVIVPNGILSGDGVCGRIKEELLREFNLHTVVRLPSGVFSPYTPIPTNILFFDRSGPTQTVWYYEHPLPPGRKKYTKTDPIQFEEFAPCIAWWNDRKEGPAAWTVRADDLLATGCDLDRRNPTQADADASRHPEIITTSIGKKAHEISALMNTISDVLDRHREELDATGGRGPEWRLMPLSSCMHLVDDEHRVDPSKSYPNLGIYSFGRGLFRKLPIDGTTTSAKTLHRVRAGQFIYSRLFAFEGSYGLVTPEFDGFFVSDEYPTFECDPEIVRARFVAAYFRSENVWKRVAVGSKGLGDRRQRVQPGQVLGHEILLPPLEWQDKIVEIQDQADRARAISGDVADLLSALFPAFLDRVFSGGL
jgi:type I restriction enzyme M protein